MAEQRAQPSTVQALRSLLDDTTSRPRRDSYHKMGMSTDSSQECLEESQQYLKYIQSLKYEVHYDEVYPNIIVGGENAARNKECLTRLGVTHILNTAQGSGIGQVDTDETYYRMQGIKFMGLPLDDAEETDILRHLDEVASFIDEALRDKGRVLVHCVLGMSRSPSVLAAYLMYRKRMTAVEALKTIRQRREIHPNSGFLQQLCDLDLKLHRDPRTS